MPTTVELEIFVARRDEGLGREGVDGGAQVRLVGGTGYVVVGVVAQERGEAEGVVEGGGEEGEEEEEEGSGWFGEGEHCVFWFCCFCLQNCQVQMPSCLGVSLFSQPLLLVSLSLSLSLKKKPSRE